MKVDERRGEAAGGLNSSLNINQGASERIRLTSSGERIDEREREREREREEGGRMAAGAKRKRGGWPMVTQNCCVTCTLVCAGAPPSRVFN